jgi:DNA-binding NarL/FixJ family response regulator
MRVILVGTAGDRARLRERLPHGALDIVAECATVEAARRLAVDADGVLIAGPERQEGREDRERLDGREAADRLEEIDDPVEPLTPREVQVLELLAEGMSNKAIAERLGISDQTVKFHVASISGKLGAANRTDAVRRGVRRGLITL